MSRESGSVAFIVGGASGIGEATADALTANHWRVVIGDRDLRAAETVAARLTNAGREAVATGLDVTDVVSVDRATTEAAAAWGRLDAVVPCAGVIDPSPSEDATDDSIFRMIDIHLMGAIRCIRAAFPYLREAPTPAVVALSSVTAHIGAPHRMSYAAAKGGIEAVVRTLAVEWAGHGIRINAVAPGWVRTPMVTRAVEEGRLDASTLADLSPLGRMAEPFEVAEAIAFLLSVSAGFITGTILLIDGALSVKGPWPQGYKPSR